MSRWGAGVLLALSRDPGAGDYAAAVQHWTADNALDRLRWAFQGFDARVRDRDVLDFGCGEGWQSLALARLGARSVVGVDINASALATARRTAEGHADLRGRLSFADRLAAGVTFDVVLSKDSMEHFSDPRAILTALAGALRPEGRLLVTFGPPWWAPYGSHMHFFTRVPWLPLWFSEDSVLRARAHFRRDGATRYEDVESGLNRMSLARFERLVAEAGLVFERRSYWCVRGVNVLGRLPLLRELFVTNVAAVLRRR